MSVTAERASDQERVGEVWMRLPRDLDRNAAFDCGNAFARAMTQTTSMIVMVCSDVRFVDSGGLRFLLASERAASAAGVRLVIAEPSPILLQLIQFTGVSDYLHIEEPRPIDLIEEPHPALQRGHSPHWFPVAAPLD